MDQAKLIETLRIPELKRGTLAVELTPKALQEWREGLPLANLQETTRQVFTLLPQAKTLQDIEALLPWNIALPATPSVAA